MLRGGRRGGDGGERGKTKVFILFIYFPNHTGTTSKKEVSIINT
jgi:hypothetical protein